MFKIGMFSKMSMTTIKTLHYYDEEELLKPAYIDPINAYRYYEAEQLITLYHITSLRQVGFCIDEIKQILSEDDMQSFILAKLQETQQEAKYVQDKLSRLVHMLRIYQKDAEISYQSVIKELPECIVYSKQTVLKSYSDIHNFIKGTQAEISLANPYLESLQPLYCFMSYHDAGFKEEDILVEYCHAVTTKGLDTKDITFKRLPHKLGVSILHKGAYTNFPKAYRFITNWINENDYEINGPPRGCNIDGEWNKGHEDDWITEIQIPIKKNSTI